MRHLLFSDDGDLPRRHGEDGGEGRGNAGLPVGGDTTRHQVDEGKRKLENSLDIQPPPGVR